MLDVPKHLPWYDNKWMNRYHAACEFLAEHDPAKLAVFEAAMAPLRTRTDFEVTEVVDLLDPITLDMARDVVKSVRPAQMEKNELGSFGRFVIRDHEAFSLLQDRMTDRVGELVGEEVEPSYNFLSLYLSLGVCPVHLDAPSAKWTVDICIEQSEPWPISISRTVPWPDASRSFGKDWQAELKADPDLGFRAYEMQPGNALIFSGSAQYHYRDPIPGNPGRGFCNLVFLHYVPKGTGAYVATDRWADYFAVPELVFSKSRGAEKK